MKNKLAAIVIVALGLFVSTITFADAQVYPNIPANTVLGRLGAGQSGPPQAIPTSVLLSSIILGANEVFGNAADVSGPAIGLSQTQLTALCNVFTSSLSGCVPASGGGTTKYLRADGTWSASGNVSGPGSSTSGDVTSWNGTGGTLLQDSGKPASALPSAAGQLPGTAAQDNASAGNVGEYQSSVVLVGSAVSLTSGSTSNITSLSLSAGDWDVSGTFFSNPASSTVTAAVEAGITESSGAIPTIPGDAHSLAIIQGSLGTTTSQVLPIQPARVSVGGTTTVYLVANVAFSASTMSGYGILRARRVR